MSTIALTVVSGETIAIGLSIPGVQGPIGNDTLPSGGTVGQLIIKQSSVDYDAAWTTSISGVTINSSIASGLTLQGTVSGGTFVSSTLSGVVTNVGTVSGGTYTSPSISGATIFASTLSGNTIAGALVHPLGAVGTPSITFTGDPDTGIYSPGADQLAVTSNGGERVRVTSAGLVGIGTSAPIAGSLLDVRGAIHSSTYFWDRVSSSEATATRGLLFTIDGVDYGRVYSPNGKSVAIQAGNGTLTDAVTVDQTGLVGIGTTSPATTLDVNGDVTITDKIIHGGDIDTAIRFPAADTVSIETAGGERARIDSSGRVLIGTSTGVGVSSASIPLLTVRTVGISTAFIADRTDNVGGILSLAKSRSDTLGGTTIVQNNDILGQIRFAGADGVDLESYGALISAEVDGTPSASDMPGRLVFSVTADAAASPTEALRISNDRSITVSDGGHISVGTTTGTKIGTATTQKIGFYNATPVVQPTAVADATDAATVITQLNALLTRMRNLGLIAT
jgi:hypothetical protein